MSEGQTKRRTEGARDEQRPFLVPKALSLYFSISMNNKVETTRGGRGVKTTLEIERGGRGGKRLWLYGE